MTDREVAFLVPAGIDDPARVSGGNAYDRRVRDGLRARGWRVSTAEVGDARDVAAALADLPPGATVLMDGLVALWAPDEVAAATRRLRIMLLAHMVVAAFPDASASEVAAERDVLAAAHRIIVTSRWTAAELGRRRLAEPDRVTVAAPGVDVPHVLPDPEATDDRELLCVGVIAPHKGQDTLLDALSRLPERDWTCTIVGSAAPQSEFASSVSRDAQRFGGRVRLSGVLTGSELATRYRRGGLLVAPSRVESSGMAIAEARAHGLPVVAARVGGIPDTVSGGGAVLVPPDDPAALAAALDAWMTDPALRRRLRTEAQAARTALPTWADTVIAVAGALDGS